MSYDPTKLMDATDPLAPVYRLRLQLQDNDEDEYLVDAEYQYILAINNGDEGVSVLDAARAILAQLSQFERTREGQIEIYADSAKKYAEWINNFLERSVTASSSVVLLGGVSKREVNRVREDNDSQGAGYTQDYLFNQTERTFGGGSEAAGTEFNNRDRGNTFRLRKP